MVLRSPPPTPSANGAPTDETSTNTAPTGGTSTSQASTSGSSTSRASAAEVLNKRIDDLQVATQQQLAEMKDENSGQFEAINKALSTIMNTIVGAHQPPSQQSTSATASASASTLRHVEHPAAGDAIDDGDGASQLDDRSDVSVVQQQQAKKLHDLPLFSGAPEEWADFSALFTQSTQAYNYSPLDNNIRLRKSLVGCAREAVQALLMDANDTDKVMAALERRFGRPDLFVQASLRQLRSIAPIAETRQELIVLYASKVANTLYALDKPKTKRFLLNPDLLEDLVLKLPPTRRCEWGNYAVRLEDYPTLHDFSRWLDEVATAVSFMTPAALLASTLTMPAASRARTSGTQQQQGPSRERMMLAAPQFSADCGVCSSVEHGTEDCAQFKRANVNARWETVRENKLCFTCLNRGHGSSSCPARKQCGVGGCLRPHHMMLHSNPFQRERGDRASSGAEPNVDRAAMLHADEPVGESEGVEVTERVQLGRMPDGGEARVLFRMLPVQVTGPAGTVDTFAMFDEGSTITIIERSLADTLELRGPETMLNVQWFGGRFVSEMSRSVSISIRGMDKNAKQYNLNRVRTMSDMDLPIQTVNMEMLSERYPCMRGLPIASFTNAAAQVLIGVNRALLGVTMRHVCTSAEGPVATKTKLGWAICGPTQTRNETTERILMVKPAWMTELHDEVKRHFSLEAVGVNAAGAAISHEDRRARGIMESTTRLVGDRYETGLLWREDDIRLPNSRPLAEKRLLALERKMARDPTYGARYKEVIAGLLASGYARKLSVSEAERTGHRTWYLPHFAALNPNKPEKLRVVFDAAACVNGTSLNSMLVKGPDNNRSLVAVLHNFRLGKVGVCADIKEMFLRVKIQRDDVDAQRFLWRETTDQPIGVYVMDSMIFGAACSPSSAQFIKNKNADDNGDGEAEAVRVIKEAHYVDDMVASFDSTDDAIRVSRAVIDIHQRGGFELRGFVSNDSMVVRAIGGVDDSEASLDLQLDATATDKILGMHWCTSDDTFRFRLAFNRVDAAVIDGTRIATKREILSAVMSIYDPFGILGSFTIYGKIILQDIWRHGSHWDDGVQADIHEQWCQWIAKFGECREVRLARCYGLNATEPVQLHIFADSSQSAMATVAYWRVVDGNGGWRLVFVMGKSRVAPRKVISVPRLELQAAILAVRLKQHIHTTHPLVAIESTTIWTDSKTVVQWVRSSKSHFPPFVAHRLAEIWEETAVNEWRWVPTKDNPADDATRALYPVRYTAVNRWLCGPDYLRMTEDQWPMEDPAQRLCEDGTERGQPCSVHLVCTAEFAPLVQYTRFSQYFRLIRTMAYVLRFVSNTRSTDKRRGALVPAEITKAELYLVQAVQREAFGEELKALRSGTTVGVSSSIRSLMPVLDDDGVMRVRGRIDRAEFLSADARRPTILPKVHPLTDLLVTHYHRQLRHQNQAAVIGEIRLKYWVPHLRVVVNRVKSKCQVCRLKAARPSEPVLGQLPVDRLTPFVRPFTFCGVDYFGPLTVTVGRKHEKRYVALFTCMTIRACHLELATDLSTDAFIICLRNFMNLRGTPMVIRSDNGTNFVGASRELRDAIDLLDHDAIQNELGVKRVEWKFNCPSHPQAGGCWERLVQCVKRVLTATVKEVAPKVDTMRSLLLEAANIVNSRPLTHLPVDNDEDEPLTPNHFLLGGSNSTQTPGDDDNKLMCLRKQWRVAQALKNRFWKRWLQEYLPDLTRRAKVYEEHPELKIGSLVLIVDALLPRGQWRRGRITAVYPGIDGKVRCALVKTADSEFRRPVSKLAVLNVKGES